MVIMEPHPCCFCLSKKNPTTDIFNDNHVSSTPLLVQIMDCSAMMQLLPDDGKPKTVCNACRMCIDIRYRFKKLFEKLAVESMVYFITGILPPETEDDVPEISEELGQHYDKFFVLQAAKVNSTNTNN